MANENDLSVKQEQIINALRKMFEQLGRPPTRDEFRKATHLGRAVEDCFGGSYNRAKIAAGLSDGTRNMSVPTTNDCTAEEIKRNTRLNNEISKLRSQVAELQGEAVNADIIRDLIGSVKPEDMAGDKDWIKGAKNPKSSLTGIPFLLLSDIHFDEVVKPEQIGNTNEYNHEIAVARIQHTFKATIELLKYHMNAPKYDGIICALLGDLLSGVIHEELAETNEQCMNQSIFDLSDLLITGIGGLADEFGKVFVPCVVGNHGRFHKKPRHKNKVFDNFEWLIYQYLVRYFKNDKRVSFDVPEGSDSMFQVYDQKICLTHGDQFKGGGGIAGIFSPLMLGMARKQRRQAAVNNPFDIMMMGHWHQLINTQSLIINGSIKGYDSFAYDLNFPFERPQQALNIFNPERGITFRMPVFCDGYANKKKISISSRLSVW